jgi:ribonuclease D
MTLTIDKEEINKLPAMEFPGEIIEVVTPEGAKRAVEVLMKEKVLGFDTETRPSFTKGESYTPSLLQLSTATHAFLFRLKFYEFPDSLKELLESPDVIKTGIGIKDDIHGLNKIIKFKPAGFVDLAEEVKHFGMTSASLRSLTAIFLERRLFKKAKTTNWERRELTDAQIRYAAIDAYVGLLIYEKICAKKEGK